MCVSPPLIGPNTKWDTVQIHRWVISRWSNAAHKSIHHQCYSMSMRLRWFTRDPDHDLITFKWTNFQKKYLELSYILILIISAPEGSKRTHTHAQSENRRVFLPPFPTSVFWQRFCSLGVEVFRKKEEKKNSPRHLAEDLTCSLAVGGRREKNTHFPTLAIFRFKDWKVKLCPYRWKPSSSNM